MLGQNHFAEPTQHVLTFLHPILICRVTYWALVELLLCYLKVLQTYLWDCKENFRIELRRLLWTSQTKNKEDLPLNPSQSHLRPQQSIPLLQAPDVSPLDWPAKDQSDIVSLRCFWRYNLYTSLFRCPKKHNCFWNHLKSLSSKPGIWLAVNVEQLWQRVVSICRQSEQKFLEIQGFNSLNLIYSPKTRDWNCWEKDFWMFL
jgi:hypothetical protein